MFKTHVDGLGYTRCVRPKTKTQVILLIPPEFDYPRKKLTVMFILEEKKLRTSKCPSKF
jgi:hypothetical protein